jgi:hypothetical protein
MIDQFIIERVEQGKHEGRRPISHDVVHVYAAGRAGGERIKASVQAERHIGEDKVFTYSQSTVKAKVERPGSTTFRGEVRAADIDEGCKLAEERESKGPEFTMHLDCKRGKMVNIRSGSTEACQGREELLMFHFFSARPA